MATCEFWVNETFQFGSGVKRIDSIISVSDLFVKSEMAKGKHKNGKWLSSLLNHCTPNDDYTAEILCTERRPSEVAEDESAEIIGQIKKEMDLIGAGYDNRWSVKRFQTELIKAKKERGL